MSEHKHTHRDCYQFAPIDVVKGICHRTKKTIPADGETCGEFDRIPKCRHCKNFAADTNTVEIGVCDASMHTPKFAAYPDMVSTTCEMYEAN